MRAHHRQGRAGACAHAGGAMCVPAGGAGGGAQGGPPAGLRAAAPPHGPPARPASAHARAGAARPRGVGQGRILRTVSVLLWCVWGRRRQPQRGLRHARGRERKWVGRAARRRAGLRMVRAPRARARAPGRPHTDGRGRRVAWRRPPGPRFTSRPRAPPPRPARARRRARGPAFRVFRVVLGWRGGRAIAGRCPWGRAPPRGGGGRAAC
jgi:hypothetical protein